jgi:hypothetical protein
MLNLPQGLKYRDSFSRFELLEVTMNGIPKPCSEMRRLRENLRTANPEGQNLIASRISRHMRDCEICSEWWEYIWEKSSFHKEDECKKS